MPKDFSESTEYMTADERKKKHAEKRMLNKLRKKEQHSSRKRKVLKLDNEVSFIRQNILK